MKYYKILIILVCVSSIVLFSCEEEGAHAPLVFDNQSPNPVTNVELTPTPGGFDVKFTAPTNTDLLYVKANFETQGLGATELRASKYSNSFEIRGFATEEEKTITFVAVDKSGNESSIVTATGIPLRAPILDVESTMTVNADFGGARFAWQNSAEGNLVIELLAENEFGELDVAQTLYSTVVDGLYNLRGYESVPTKFAVVASDQYKNRTDTIFPTTEDRLLTPLFETTLDKDLFSQYHLTGDELWNTFGGVVTELWNDVTNNSGDYARATLVQDRTFFTMDLGVHVKLSRFKLHQRRTRYFSEGAPKEYTIYGTNEVPSADGDMSGWTKLRDCVATTPSGNTYIGSNSGQPLTNEDLEHALNGDEFSLGGTPEVRYIRIEFTKNFLVSSFIIFSELSFYGELQ